MANYWMHNGFVTVEGEKMSKSLGNFYTVHDVLKEWPGEAIRLLGGERKQGQAPRGQLERLLETNLKRLQKRS